jgi:competence protein ComEC
VLLLALSIGVLTGTALGLLMAPPLPSHGAFASALVLCVCGLIASWRLQLARWAGIMLFAAVLSGARAQLDRSELEASALPANVEAVRGTIAGVPRTLGRASTFIVEVDDVLSGGEWEARTGRVEARNFGWAPAEGDRVEISGEARPLVDLPGAPRATILRRQRVTQEFEVERMRLLAGSSDQEARFDPVELRSWMEERINIYLEAPQSALLAGLLLGSRSELSPEVRAQFAQTGTSHIVAVSGFNVVIVSGFVGLVALRPLGVRGSALAAILAVIAYTLIVGAPPSAVRAAMMAGIALTARVVGRPADGINALMVAGAGMALWDPVVLQDLGFQLSMLATAGLILLIPQWDRARSWRTGALYFAMTPLAAQIATLPLVLHTFHSLSLVAVGANVLVAPMLPLAMATGGLLILVADLEPLAIAVSWLAWLPATAILESVRMLASVPGAWVATGAFPTLAMLISYVGLLFWILQKSPELRGFERFRRMIGVAAPIALGATVATLLVPMGSTNQLTGELLDSGTLIARSPSGKTLIVGTAASPQVLTASVAEHLPFAKRSIEVVILNDDLPASWRGVRAIAERYAVELLVIPGPALSDEFAAGVGQVVEAIDETRIDLGDETVVRILPHHAVAQNRSRTVPLAIAYGLTGISFPGQGNVVPVAEPDGWVSVIRVGDAVADSSNTAARVRWGRAASQSMNSPGTLDLAPRSDGPIGFSSDGYQLTIQWTGCVDQASACSAVIGGSEPQRE